MILNVPIGNSWKKGDSRLHCFVSNYKAPMVTDFFNADTFTVYFVHFAGIDSIGSGTCYSTDAQSCHPIHATEGEDKQENIGHYCLSAVSDFPESWWGIYCDKGSDTSCHVVEEIPSHVTQLNSAYASWESGFKKYTENLPDEFYEQVTNTIESQLTSMSATLKETITIERIAQVVAQVPQYLISFLVYLIALFCSCLNCRCYSQNCTVL